MCYSPIIEIASWHLLDGFISDCAKAHNSVVFSPSDKAYCTGYNDVLIHDISNSQTLHNELDPQCTQ